MRFHQLELLVFMATSGLAGWALPRRPPSPVLRLVAAVCVVAAVLSQYLLSFPWNLSQRDAMALWFALPATALGAAALEPDASAVRRRRLLLAAGALIGMATTLKPYFGLMGAPMFVGALTVLPRGHRGRGAYHLLLGGLLGTLPALIFLLSLGSLRDYLRDGFVYGPRFYQGVDDRTVRSILESPNDPFHWLRAAVASTFVGLTLIGLGGLPRRDLPLVLAPSAAVAVVLIQHKGFMYHVHPVTGLTLLLWAHLLLTAVERIPARVLPALAVGLGGAMLVLWSASLLRTSALLAPVVLEYERLTDEPLRDLKPGPALGRRDFFPRELRLAGAWLQAHTPPDSRVYLYGHDVAVLLYARRRPATATLVNAGIDLAGSLVPPRRDQLSADRVRGLEEVQRFNIADDLRRLRRDPPAAAVLIDRSPWMTEPTALGDLQRHAPAIAAWLQSNYAEAGGFGPVRIWMPRPR